TLDVDDLGPGVGLHSVKEARRVVGPHPEIARPVLVADRRRRRAGIIQEVIARRLVGLAAQVVDIVDAVERSLDDAGILPGLDLLLQSVAFRPAGDFDESRDPVEGSKHFVLDRARPDHARPADHHRGAHAALPGAQLAALNGVTPPSGKVIVSAPLSVVKTTIVLLVWPMSSIFLSTTPMLSSICFMPASLTPQYLRPGSPTMARHLCCITVVMFIIAGLDR